MYIHVKVKTKQKSEHIKELKVGYFEVCVKEKAQKNMANKAVLELVKRYFKVSVARIVNGHHSPNKLILIED